MGVPQVAKDTQLLWPEAALPWSAAGHGRSVYGGLPRVVAVLATAGLFDGTELQGTPARRDIPRRPSNQTFVAVPNLKKKHVSSTTVSTKHVQISVVDSCFFYRSDCSIRSNIRTKILSISELYRALQEEGRSCSPNAWMRLSRLSILSRHTGSCPRDGSVLVSM